MRSTWSTWVLDEFQHELNVHLNLFHLLAELVAFRTSALNYYCWLKPEA